MVIARGKGRWGEVDIGKGGEGATERDFAWGGECTMQRAGDVLTSCTLEACVVLGTNVSPINSVRKDKPLGLGPWGPLDKVTPTRGMGEPKGNF